MEYQFVSAINVDNPFLPEQAIWERNRQRSPQCQRGHRGSVFLEGSVGGVSVAYRNYEIIPMEEEF